MSITADTQRGRHAFAVIALLAFMSGALAGCGTTVAGGESGGPTGAGLGLAQGGVSTAATSSSAPPLGDTVGSAGATSGETAIAVPTQPGSNPGSMSQRQGSTGSRLKGLGFDEKNVYLGIEYTADFNEFASSAGFNSLASGDGKALASAVVNYLNQHGGVLGRRIVPIYHATSTAQVASNPATAAEATCAAFTQDHKVYAAVTISDAMACLSRAHVPTAYTGSMIPVDQQHLAQYAPYAYDPPAMSYSNLTPIWIDRLAAQGYFSKGAKIGLLYVSSGGAWEAEPRIKDDLKRQLQARGINVAAEYGVDESNASSQASTPGGAVLPFRAAGVDHVIALDASVGIFMLYADQQHYTPRYALNSYMNLASVMESVPPKSQLAGAIGVGWSPANDVDAGREHVAMPGRTLCDSLIRASGQAAASGSARFILLSYCDSIRLLAYAAIAGGGLDAGHMRAGLAKSGSIFPSALNFVSAYSATRADGGNGVRDIAYRNDCSCFQYVSTQLYAG